MGKALRQCIQALELFEWAECPACNEGRKHDVMFCQEARRGSALNAARTALDLIEEK